MRLITYKYQGSSKLGAWIKNDNYIIDLHEESRIQISDYSDEFLSMQHLIDAGPKAWNRAQQLVNSPQLEMLATSKVEILLPLLPVQLRDFLCFEQHLINSFNSAKEIQIAQSENPQQTRKILDKSDLFDIPQVWYDSPIYYNCSRMASCGTGQEICWPKYSKIWDYELEWAAVIGKKGKDISKNEAKNHIFGYTIFNDFSARDEQLRVLNAKLGPGKGKDFTHSNVFGPCIVTADEFDNPYNLKMSAKVNGELWSQGSTSTMHHTFEDIIAYISQSETIYPGEVLGSGTVGNGCGLELLKFLRSGDEIELTIEKIGSIKNKVVEN
jgi:2-keto-4-pentenoate hydratase/2-oxohepta-3-ene-1,7-dioic acid hydratase in catechol pathway